MIATTRGLVVLAVLAVALLGLSVFGGAHTRRPVDRSLVPGLDVDRIRSLAFFEGERGPVLERVGHEWRFSSGEHVEPAAIDAVLTALRGGRWHRRVAARTVAAGKGDRRGISIDGTKLVVGDDMPATGQTWIIRGDDALLVDRWIATALTPTTLELHVRHPLACPSAVTAELGDTKLRIDGARLVEPRELWVDERWRQSLTDACAQLELVALEGKRDGRKGLHIVADGEVTELGACPGARVFINSSTGPGCVEAAALRALTDALADPQPDPRPLPFAAASLTLLDGSVVDIAAMNIGDVDAEPERVRELVEALSTRGTIRPRPTTKPTGTLTATDRAGTAVVLELFDRAPGRSIARRGEPVAIELTPDAWATVTRPTSMLRTSQLWREDEVNIAKIHVDGVTWTRGPVLGVWNRQPDGKRDVTLVDALAEALANVRAPGNPPPTAIAHRVRVTFAPPVGASITHELELAAPSERGCAARVDGKPVLLPLGLCTAVAALAAQQR